MLIGRMEGERGVLLLMCLHTDQEDSINVVGGTFTWDSPERPVLSE